MAVWLPWLGLGSIIAALVGGAFMFKVNRAQATQITETARSMAKSTALAEADKMIEYANLRYDALHDDYRRCNSRLNTAVKATDAVIEVVEILTAHAVPSESGEEFTITVSKDEIARIRTATRDARRSLLYQEE